MSTITITFGDQAENHIGMEKFGAMATEGFSINELQIFNNNLQTTNNEYYNLSDLVDTSVEEAGILIIRNGLEILSNNRIDELKKELENLVPDKKYFDIRRKKVLNKHARHNLCFGDISQEPEYEKGKGRIVCYNDVPVLKDVRENLPKMFGEKANNLVAEANYYYDINKCGIGFHGDGERKKVIAFRIGSSIPLHYQWYHHSKPIGKRMIIPLYNGDVYIMSEKAVGTDWKKHSIPTLRHATGCYKYVK